MKVVNEIELLTLSSQYDLNMYAVNKFKNKNYINMKVKHISEFLEFVEENDFKNVFYLYKYYDVNAYIIPIEWYSEEKEVFKKRVKKHNEILKQYDFTIAYHLTLATIQEGVLMYVEVENNWIPTNLEHAEYAIETIEKEIYGKDKKTTRDIKKQDEQALQEIMFADPEFSYCKNQDLRYWYLADLLEEEGMEKYGYLFEPHFGIASTGKAKVFLDKSWMVYQEKKDN